MTLQLRSEGQVGIKLLPRCKFSFTSQNAVQNISSKNVLMVCQPSRVETVRLPCNCVGETATFRNDGRSDTGLQLQLPERQGISSFDLYLWTLYGFRGGASFDIALAKMALDTDISMLFFSGNEIHWTFSQLQSIAFMFNPLSLDIQQNHLVHFVFFMLIIYFSFALGQPVLYISDTHIYHIPSRYACLSLCLQSYGIIL